MSKPHTHTHTHNIQYLFQNQLCLEGHLCTLKVAWPDGEDEHIYCPGFDGPFYTLCFEEEKCNLFLKKKKLTLATDGKTCIGYRWGGGGGKKWSQGSSRMGTEFVGRNILLIFLVPSNGPRSLHTSRMQYDWWSLQKLIPRCSIHSGLWAVFCYSAPSYRIDCLITLVFFSCSLTCYNLI